MFDAASRPWFLVLSVVGFLAVAGGAFGAHALEGMVDEVGMERWEIGARYLATSTVPLLAVATRRRDHPEDILLRVSGVATVVGAAVFTSSLWLMALTGMTWLGAITPLGGLGMLTGWATLGWHAARAGATRQDGTGTGRSSG